MRHIRYGFAAAVTAVTVFTTAFAPFAAPSAGAQSTRSQASSSNATRAQSGSRAAPSGWVGLSVVQSGQGSDASDVAIGYPVIASVEPGSPAQAAGLVAGDTILAYNDVDARGDPLAVRRFLKPGTAVVVKVRRNSVRSLTLTVAKRSAQNAYRPAVSVTADAAASMPLMYGVPGGPIAIAAPVAEGRDAPFAGSYLARLNTGLANVLNVAPQGVLVLDVGPGSAAMQAGLRAGDVITRADSIRVVSPLEIATAMRLASDRSMTLDVVRSGSTRKVTIHW